MATQEITSNLPPRPAPLDATRWHSRAAHREWQRQDYEWVVALQAKERAARAALEKERNPGVRDMDDAAYDRMTLERHNKQVEAQREREVAAALKAQQREAFLATDGEPVNITETSGFTFLTTVEHFVRKGYTCNFSDFFVLGPVCFVMGMVKMPFATAAKAGVA
jgi:hypothetical protein